MTTYRFRLVADEHPVDIGDWLAQDREHYEKVGPYRGNPDDWTDQDVTHYRDLTWDEWSSRPDADVNNWVSYGLVLERECDMGYWHDVGASLWGLDYLGYPHRVPPSEGIYETVDQLAQQDPYLKDVVEELLAEVEADA